MIFNLYIGTYTQVLPHVHGRGRGIYHFQLDGLTGKTTTPRLVASMTNPSYLSADAAYRYIYAVSEVENYRGTAGGAVVAFAIQPDGSLQRLNSRLSGGGSPCHLTFTEDGRGLLCANYTGGSLSRLTIRPNGSLGYLAQTLQHHGHGPNPVRQEAAHVHSSLVHPSGRWICAADLGTDSLVIYRLERNRKLQPHKTIVLPAGSGPRHLLLHPLGSWLYVVGELNNTLHTLRFDPLNAEVDLLGTVSTLPDGVSRSNTAAHVASHPNGRFVYVSNRGDDSLALFQVNKNGALTPAGHFSSDGRTPRHFDLLPADNLLLAANQDSDTIEFFKINPDTGFPEGKWQSVAVPTPVCVLAIPAKRTR